MKTVLSHHQALAESVLFSLLEKNRTTATTKNVMCLISYLLTIPLGQVCVSEGIGTIQFVRLVGHSMFAL